MKGRITVAILLASSLAAAAPVPETNAEEPPAPPAPPALKLGLQAPGKKFWPAFLEVTAFNVIPSLWNTWARGKDPVTLDSWKENLSRGFAYDPDKFTTNQLSHPQQGGLYFGAARSNGWNLWQSALFTAYGSLTWEYFGETSRPSTNDLITTTLGGISSGEASFRLSDLVFDNTATGFARFLHEFAGIAVSPGRVFQRLLSGDAWRIAPNPETNRPEALAFDLSGGWIHVESQRHTDETRVYDRATVQMELRYGDPFERDLGKPFSTFWLGAEFTNGKQFVSRVQTEGLLAGRRLDGTGSERTVVGASFIFDYLDVDLAFGQQGLGFGVWSRLPLGGRWDVLPRAEALASFGEVHTSEESVVATYRNYDYGIGGGLRAGARLRLDKRDVFRIALDEVFLHTVNGPTRWNEVTILQAAGRVPLSKAFSLSAEVTYQRHKNVFPTGTQIRTGGQFRATVVWGLFDGKP